MNLDSDFDSLYKSLEDFNDAVRDVMKKKDLNATGSASESLEVRKTDTGIASFGNDYFEILDKGRRPGQMPPIDAIEKWIKARGLELNAYAVALKIKKEGTRIYKNKTLGVEIDNLIKDFEQIFQNAVESDTVIEVQKQLDFFAKQFAEKQRQS